jgi:hypothetical protein
MEIAVKLQSEYEFLNWIADCIEHGIHQPNPYSEPDTDGMALADSFYKLDREDVNEYMRVYAGPVSPKINIKTNPTSDWDEEYHLAFPDFVINRKQLRADYENQEHYNYTIPKPEDYPILYFLNWSDDFDRVGKVTNRYSYWWSLKDPELDPRLVNQKAKTWQARYADKFNELIKLYDERQQLMSKEFINQQRGS